MKATKFSARQQQFIREYLIDLNATQAAIRAGYSRRTAEQQGSRLLGYAKVAEAIQKAKDRRANRTDITSDRVLRELARIAFGDIRDLFDDAGQLLEVTELSDDAAAVLASIEVTREKTTFKGNRRVEESLIKVKAWDKLRALELIGKHLGLLKDRLEISSAPIYALPENCRPSVSSGG